MTKQTIDIGVQGNDGTGDSIRDSFRKVNENFSELYSVFKNDGLIGLGDLSDGCSYGAGQVIMGNDDGTTLIAKSLVAGSGISITRKIVQEEPAIYGLEFALRGDAKLVNDLTPTLGAPLNASQFGIGRLPDPSQAVVDEFNLAHDESTTLNELPVTVGFANANFVRLTADGTIGIADENGVIVPGPVKARTEPEIPELLIQDPANPGQYIPNPNYDPTLSGNYLINEVLPRIDSVYRGGDTMRGPLYLNDHPKDLAGTIGSYNKEDLQAATAFYVDNKTFTSNVNLYVSTSGDDLQLKTPAGREGRYWNYAFKSFGAALSHAESLINLASQEPGPYKQRLSYTDGPDQSFSTVQSVSLSGGNSTNPEMVAAYNLLKANKTFIQAETIAYINKKYVNKYEYDDTTFRNQIGSILTAVGNDLRLGSNGTYNVDTATFDITDVPGANYNTYWSAISYIHSNPTTDGLIQWTSTLDFIKSQLLEFSYNTDELSSYTTQIINSLIYDLIFKSNYQSIQAGIAFKNAETNISTDQLASILEVNPIDIVSASADSTYVTIRFATQLSNAFPVNSHILINATFAPKETGGSNITLASTEVVNSVRIVKSYEIQESTESYIKIFNTGLFETDDYTVTNGSFDRKNLINLLLLVPKVIASNTAKTSFKTNAKIISDIVTTGTIPTVIMPKVSNPSMFVNYDTVGRVSAKELLLANIPFMQAEIVAYLNSNYPNLEYDRDLCMRDVMYIVWSLAYDLMYSGNSQTVYAGKKYWINIASNLNVNERVACSDAITHLGILAESIIANDSIGKQYQQTVRQYRNDTLSNGENALGSISDNIAIVKSILETNTSITIVYPDKNAGVSDLIPIFTDITASISNYTIGTQSDVTTTTSWYMDHFYPVINDPHYLARIESLFASVKSIIQLGINPVDLPVYPTIDVQVNYYGDAQPLPNIWVEEARTILDNAAINDIISDVNTYLSTDFGITDANILAVLAVDIRNLILAVCYDITFGGTSASVNAALQMTVIDTNSITRSIISETSLLTRTKVNGHNIADVTNEMSSLIGSKFTEASKVFNDSNPLTVGEPVDLTIFTGGKYISAIKLQDIITANTDSIKNKTIKYVNTTFSGGFNYDESLCHRDLGLIVDAMAIDIITGGTWQSINAGKSFYKNASAKAVAIGTHYVQSHDGLTFAKDLINQVLTVTTKIRYQQLNQISAFVNAGSLPSTEIGVTGVTGNYALLDLDNAISIVNTNMQRILDIVENGVSIAATPTFGSGIWDIVISNGGMGFVDQGSPKNNDIFPAKVIVGVGKVTNNPLTAIAPSDAYASIVKYIPGTETSNSSTDTIQVRLTRPGFFKVGEELEFGETVRDLNITIFVESGIYYDDFPLRIPPNVSIRGDEMRRTLLRPIDRESQSPWRKIFFYRDAIIDALEVGLIDYDTNIAPATDLGISATLDGLSGKIVVTLSNNYQALLSWVGKVIADNIVPVEGNKKRGKAVIDSISGNTMNCTVIYPFDVAGEKSPGNWFLFDTINYGRHYLVDPLDPTSPAKNNKDIDVFLCNEGNRIIGITFQGQGGFGMVLDPEGNIKTKSPYIQECTSFSQSNNYKRFAGGQFIDGFAGRVYGTIKQIDDAGITVTVVGETNSGLDIRPPQPPCSFYVRGKRYQIDDVVSFDANTKTVVLTLDKTTTYMYDPISHELVYNEEKAKRDVWYVVDAVVTDAILGTNYRAVHAGRAFLRSYSGLLTGALQGLTKAGIEKAVELARIELPDLTLSSTIITSMLINGVSATPNELIWSDTGKTANEIKARNIIQANKDFIKAEITAYISNNYVLSNYPRYNVLTSQRDVSYLVDAITYDLYYGGNSQTYDCAVSLFYKDSSNQYVSVVDGETSVCAAAHTRLREILKSIVKGESVSVSPGVDPTTQIKTLPATNAFDSTIDDLCNIVINYVDSNPNVSSTLPTVVWPVISGTSAAAYSALNINHTQLALDVIQFLNNGADTVINLETGGNRAMLANDFAMFNDLAYGVLATNGAFTEQVCTFTYYAHTGFWANNGSNLRGVGCSNTFGNYGLRASGYDVTELPDSVNLANHMIQTATVYKQGTVADEMTPTETTPATSLWIVNYDYIPTNGSGLEIDHSVMGGIMTSYIITSVEYTTIQYQNKIVLKLNLSTSGDNNTASSGLAKALYDGQVVSIRSLKNVKFINVDNVKPTRPSTALQYTDNLNDVYRIVAYNLAESTGDLLDPNIAILQSDNSFAYYNLMIDPNSIINGDPSTSVVADVVSGSTSSTTLVVNNVSGTIAIGQVITGVGFAGQFVGNVTGPNGQGEYTITLDSINASLVKSPSVQPAGRVKFSTKTQGYNIGDTKLAVSEITQTSVIDQINKGTYITSWNGRLHLVLKYVSPVVVISKTCVTYDNSVITISGITTTIKVNDFIIGKNAGLNTFTGFVDSIAFTSADTLVTVRDGSGTLLNGYNITFGIASNGYIEIAPNSILNNSADGTPLPAMTLTATNPKQLQEGSTVATLVTFDVPYNKDGVLPKIDSYITVSGNSNSYNGTYQITNVKNETSMQISEITGFVVGMVVTTSSPTAYISGLGAIIQSIDVPTSTITVSPACWIPSGSAIKASIAAYVAEITIENGGSGYPDTPVLNLFGGDYIQKATAVCKVVDGVITEARIVKRGDGYLDIPEVQVVLPPGLSPTTQAVITVKLSTPVVLDTTASEGQTVSTVTMLYPEDPGVFTTATPKTITNSPVPATYNSGYSVTYQFASGTAPVDNDWYKIEGNDNALYNGFVQVISGTATSATVYYPLNPGVYGTGTTTITKTGTSGESETLGISKPFSRTSSYTLKLGHPINSSGQVTTRISTCRATGHDFCDIGTGGYSTTNIPYSIYGDPALPRNASHETLDEGVGRCFYVSTNQDGIFRVGRFFSVDQGTGTVTFSSKISLSNIEGFGFSRGVVVNEFSSDSSLTNNAADTVPVQSAVRGYIDKRLGLDHGGSALPFSSWIGPGFLPLNGSLPMSSDLIMGGNLITNVKAPVSDFDATNKKYVDDLISANNTLAEMGDIDITESSLSNAQMLVYKSSNWINSTLTGDITLSFTGNSLVSTIGSNKISNSMVNSNAAIDQSKLSLSAASTRSNATGITQANLGVASFSDKVFTSTSGWIDLVSSTSNATGVLLSKLQWIPKGHILGNLTTSGINSNIEVTTVTPAEIVDVGDGIKNALFTSVGAMSVSSVTGTKTYTVIPYTTVGATNSIVQTDSVGAIDVKQLKIDSYPTIDTVNVDDTLPNRQVKFTTPGNVDFIVAHGGAAASTVVAVTGTLDVSAANNVLKTKTLSAGSTTATGVITGNWSLSTDSKLNLALGETALAATGITATDTRPKIRPAIMFDFANSKSLDPRITFTRASVATYFNAAGIMKTAASNQPRFDHDPITKESKGLLLEESRTNLIEHSKTFNTSGGTYNWTYTNVTRANSTILAPDGNLAYQFTSNSAGATMVFNDTRPASATRVFSVWIKRIAGTGTISYKLGNVDNWVAIPNDDFTSLVRLQFKESVTTTNKVSLQFSDANNTIVLWGAQYEDGDYASSYIPTTNASYRRETDMAEVTGTNFSSWYQPSEGTIVVSQSALGIASTPGEYGGFKIQNATPTDYIMVGCRSNGSTLVYNASCKTNTSTVQFNFTGLTSSTLNNTVIHAVSYSSTASYTYNKTDPVETDNAVALPTNLTMLRIGSGNGAQYIAKVAYYAKQLSGSELLVITTP